MEDNLEYIRQLFQVVSNDSILIINSQDKLRRLYCPFRALVVIPVGQLYEGQRVLVESVKMTLKLEDVFIVEGKAYYLYYFRIMLEDP